MFLARIIRQSTKRVKIKEYKEYDITGIDRLEDVLALL